MTNTNKTLALAISGAFALSVGMANVNAGENPFSATVLSNGYQVADASSKSTDGKCGTGKCGAEKKEAKDGKCGHEKAKDGKCGHEKGKEGDCGH